jgi:hypothetical protein
MMYLCGTFFCVDVPKADIDDVPLWDIFAPQRLGDWAITSPEKTDEGHHATT